MVLGRVGFDVSIAPVFIPTKIPHDVFLGNEGLEVVNGFGEMDFAGYDRVEPTFDDAPDTYESIWRPTVQRL